jgi:hypothetical protein
MLSLNYHAPISNGQIGDAKKVPSFTEHYLLNMYISYFYSTNIFLHKTDMHKLMCLQILITESYLERDRSRDTLHWVHNK